MGKEKAYIPTVFRLAWPDDKKGIVPQGQHYKFGFGNGRIINDMASDVESLSKVTSSLRCFVQ